MPAAPHESDQQTLFKEHVAALDLPVPVADQLCAVRLRYAKIADQSAALDTASVRATGTEATSASYANSPSSDPKMILKDLLSDALFTLEALTSEQRVCLMACLASSQDAGITEFYNWLRTCDEYSLVPNRGTLAQVCGVVGEVPAWVDESLRAFNMSLLSGIHTRSSEALQQYCNAQTVVPRMEQSFVSPDRTVIQVDQLVAAMQQQPRMYEGMIQDFPDLLKAFATTFFDAARSALTPAMDQLRQMKEEEAHNLMALIAEEFVQRSSIVMRRLGVKRQEIEQVARYHVLQSFANALTTWLIDQRHPLLRANSYTDETYRSACGSLNALLERAAAIGATLIQRSYSPHSSTYMTMEALNFSANWLSHAVEAIYRLFHGKVRPVASEPPKERGPNLTAKTQFATIVTLDRRDDVDYVVDTSEPGLSYGIQSILGQGVSDNLEVKFGTSVCSHRPHDAPTMSTVYFIPLRDLLGPAHPVTRFSEIIAREGDDLNQICMDVLSSDAPDWIEQARKNGILLRMIYRQHMSDDKRPQDREILWAGEYFLLTKEEASLLSIPAEALDDLPDGEFTRLQCAGIIPSKADPMPQESEYVCWIFFYDDPDSDDEDPPPEYEPIPTPYKTVKSRGGLVTAGSR